MPSCTNSARSNPASTPSNTSVTAGIVPHRLADAKGRSARSIGELVERGERVLERAPARLAGLGVHAAGRYGPVTPGLFGLGEQRREAAQRPHPLGEGVRRLWHDPELPPVAITCCCGSAVSAYRQNALARRIGWPREHRRRDRSTRIPSGTTPPPSGTRRSSPSVRPRPRPRSAPTVSRAPNQS